MVRAALEVFGIPELLENTLDQLDPLWGQDDVRGRQPSAELFILQRVSKGFQATIQGSKKLKRKMFLEFDGNGAQQCRLNLKKKPLFDGLHELLSDDFRDPSFETPGDIIAWISGELFPTPGSDSQTFLDCIIRPLGSRRYDGATPTDLSSSQPIDSVPITSQTQRPESNIKPDAPSWHQMKLSSKPCIIHTFVEVQFYHQRLLENFRTVIVSEPQDTLGNFADSLCRLVHLRKHELLQLHSQVLGISFQLSSLQPTGWLPGAKLDRLRRVKIKHDQQVNCGRRDGLCAFCYWASGTEYGSEETRRVFAEL